MNFKNAATGIKQQVASLALFAVFILTIGLAGMGGTVSAQPMEIKNDLADAAKDVYDWLFDGSGGPTTSFTDFDGGLTLPSTEGYSSGLTQQTNLRDFILAVTNFVLGFLGLIAVLIIIYGGFLYLTAAGEEDRAGKGKKSITYALIGMLIILGSYAIVNTILQAPSGDDRTSGGLSGSAPSLQTGFVSDANTVGNILQDGSVSGIASENLTANTPEGAAVARRQLFFSASENIRTAGRDLFTAYQKYAQINLGLQNFVRVEGIGTSADLTLLMQGKLTILEEIERTANSIGGIRDALPSARAVILSTLQRSRIVLVNAEGDELEWREWWIGQMQQELVGGGDGELHKAAEKLKEENEREFGVAIAEAGEKITQLKKRFTDTTSTIDEAFEKVIKEMNDLLASGEIQVNETLEKSQFRANADIASTPILEALQAMSDLYKGIANTPFMYAVIAASTVEGSAPLLVNFDGLRSINPLNVTIQNENYQWDFGDGTTKGGAVVENIFEKTGTYVVRLTVKPTPSQQNEPQVAAGVATMRITVRPPANRLFLKATIGQEEPFLLRQYNPDNTLFLDQNVLRVSSTEAQAGITFDASDTDPARLRSVKWNFGDSSPEIVQSGSGLELLQTHVYTEPGTYQMFLEVTDIQNNIDRKIVNVVVGSPVARIVATNGTIGKVGDVFILDGSTSRSDSGNITEYEWTGVDSATLEPPNNSTTGERLGVSFAESGIYRVTLTVTDNLGDRESQSIDIEVQSEPPIAQFTYSFPDSRQPGTVHLDASSSYDPDNQEAGLTYKWSLSANAGADYVFMPVDANARFPADAREKTTIKFLKPGTYTVGLQVKKAGNTDSSSQILEKQITVQNTLDIAWGEGPVTTILEANEESGQLTGEITATILSTSAVAYELDFGDGEIESGQIDGQVAVPHQYRQAGKYTMKATVFDDSNNENSISRKVFISSGDTPIAVASVLVNGVEVFDTTESIQVTRKDVVTFDAGKSLNTDGTSRRLNYTWDLGNGTRSAQQRVTHTYRDTGSYTAKLSVRSAEAAAGQSVTDEVTIEVVPEPPTLGGLTARVSSGNLTTPVTVTLNAIGAQDSDGRITRYRWWYYDMQSSNDALGVQVTSAPSATVSIGTRGNEGEEKSYKFCVMITDDENSSINSCDEEVLGEERSPQLEVINGPNRPPVASFTVDRTSVMVGDVVNFVSTSRDPDGQITGYFWDFEGDGFADNTVSRGANVGHTFTQVNREGIRVRLKVRDNNESEAISQPITIYVDGFAKPPVAGFTAEQEGTSRRVSFRSTSVADTAGGAEIESWSWDFNTAFDSDGDGNASNDQDSTNSNPSYQYPEYGIFRASLTVKDNQGNSNSKTQFVRVIAPTSGGANVMAAGTVNAASVLVTVAGFAIILIRLKKRNNINK